MNMMKDLLLMSLRQKADKIDWEELGSNATFLPLIYLVVMAPGFLILMGFICFLIAVVSDFTPNLFIKLGTCLIASSLVLIFSYRLMIKRQFKLKKRSDPTLNRDKPVEVSRTTTEHFLAPFVAQFQLEQKMILGKAPPETEGP